LNICLLLDSTFNETRVKLLVNKFSSIVQLQVLDLPPHTNALYSLNLSKTSPLAFKMYTFVDESYEVSHFIMHDVVFSVHNL